MANDPAIKSRALGVFRLLSACCLLTVAALPNAFAIEANSRFFKVRDYYCPDPNGNYRPYSVAGFAQPANNNLSAKLHILPTIRFAKSSVTFFDKNGLQFDPVTAPSRDVAAVRIKPKGDPVLPTQVQIPGIAAALEGVSIGSYKVPSWKTGNPARPVMLPTPKDHQEQAAVIQNAFAEYDTEIAEQTTLAAQYKDYKPEEVGLNAATISVIIDEVPVATVKLPGVAVNLPSVTLIDPTEYQKNRILEGEYQLLVSYRFLDSITRTISAQFDAKRAVRIFVEETQKAITTSKSSGFQVFNIGARRSRIRSALNKAMSTRDEVAVIESTTVVMQDATEDMVELFESHFLPTISKQEVIARHDAAAAAATAAGATDLAKIHKDYADGLRNNNELKEVDAVAAAAALASQNYIAFIANGVRSINSSDNRADTFRRIENNESEIDRRSEWNDVRSVSVAREVSVPVHPETEVARKPRHGIVKVAADTPFATIQWITERNGTMQMYRSYLERGLVIACLEKDGPAANAGLYPGMVIESIGTTTVSNSTTEPDFEDLLSSYSPGDVVPILVLQSNKDAMVTERKTYRIRLKTGPPEDQLH